LRSTNVAGASGATRSRSHAPTKGVAPSAAMTDSTRVPVVDEKSNRPLARGRLLLEAGRLFHPKARSTNLRPAASRPRSSTAARVLEQGRRQKARVLELPPDRS